MPTLPPTSLLTSARAASPKLSDKVAVATLQQPKSQPISRDTTHMPSASTVRGRTSTTGGASTSRLRAGSPADLVRTNAMAGGARIDRVNPLTGARTDHVDEDAAFEAQARRDAAGGIVTVDLSKVRDNYRYGVLMIGDARPSAVVKANGYGLGADIMARTLVSEGCREFFVARASEAVDLRASLKRDRPDRVDEVAINVLDGLVPGSNPKWLMKHKITPVLNSLDQVRAWNAAGAAENRKLPAILQFDSGMSRAGMSRDLHGNSELEQLLKDVDEGRLQNIDVKLVMTHLSDSGDAPAVPGAPNNTVRQPGEKSAQQLEAFDRIADQVVARFPDARKSIGASSTVFLDPKFHKDLVRMGGTFHGQAPFEAETNPLAQVVRLEAKLDQIHTYEKGARAGYGGTWEVTRDQERHATFGLGYTDGLPRLANGNDDQNRPYAKVTGKSGRQYDAPLVSKLSMDMLSLDLTDIPADELSPGAKVTLIGDGITSDHFGAMFRTNPSEPQVKFSDRLVMDFVDKNAPKPHDEPNPGASPNVWGPQHETAAAG